MRVAARGYRSGSSYSKGSKTHPCGKFIRFTKEENDKLTKLCRKRSLTVQSFGHAAVMRALNEADLGKKAAGESEHEPEQPLQPEGLPGLGIRDRLRESAEDDEFYERRSESVPSTGTSASAPVLTQARTIDDTILALARTVVAAPQSYRKAVLKDALSALTRGRTLEESMRLADDLDAAIARVGGIPQTALERVRARAGR